MSLTLFACPGGALLLPDPTLVLVDRADGGHLVVNPPRTVWDRSELTPIELEYWSYLVAAAGRAMLDLLPQLEGGCINYWDAGNWALHPEAEPRGPKVGNKHRPLHLHLLGRSRTATDPSFIWGEAPQWPAYAERHAWAARHQRLTADECWAIVQQVAHTLRATYRMPLDRLGAWCRCEPCCYPTVRTPGQEPAHCTECRIPT